MKNTHCQEVYHEQAICHPFLLVVLLLSAFPVLTFAQEDPSTPVADRSAALQETTFIEPAGGWPYGSAEAIAADTGRNLIFLGSGGTALVLDVSNPLTCTFE